MKFHKYLEQLLGNKAAISVLRALFEYKGMVFTVRRLAETANISHTEANQTIDRLEKLGIVKVQPVGKAYRLSLNDKSYALNKIVGPIFIAENKTLETLAQVLKKHLDTKKIISSAVFGSVAREEEKEDSDIDLLVISDYPDDSYAVIGNAKTEVSEIFGGNISPIVFSKKEFIAKKRSDLVRSILDDHIMIQGIELEKIK
ncbi:MAG: nucleotidyltransferase domain-containing protein [Nitrosotalea sp.]